MRSALLCGRDLGQVGPIETVAEGRAAIALSRGGAAKTYRHTDPNEDAAVFVIGAGGVLAAVADGHGGEYGARVVLEHLLQELAPAACAAESPAGDRASWQDFLYAGVQAAGRCIARYASEHEVGLAPTTLALVVVRPDERTWAWACVGDSHAFRVDGDGAFDVATAASRQRYFLGAPEESWHHDATALGFEPLADARTIVLATDGLSEQGIGLDDPSGTIAELIRAAREIEPGQRSQWIARQVAERANASHRQRSSGDNLAAAVIGP